MMAAACGALIMFAECPKVGIIIKQLTGCRGEPSIKKNNSN
jgi:hypothetical protein